MCGNVKETKYKCKAHITYEFIVEAESAEEAENNVFETISDDIAKGTIPVDVYDSGGCFPVPMLLSLDVVPID
jgi:hypothetical protein